MAGKFYAVKEGRSTGVFASWAECKKQVDGYSGAKYKSFTSMQDATAYLNDGIAGEDTSEALVAYVDGSYNSVTKEFSYGVVILNEGKEITFNEKMNDKELAAMRNVAGEIKGAEAAMRYAIENGFDNIAIYHDYEGIARWCLGDWKTNKEGTKAYKAFYDGIKINSMSVL